MRPLVRRSHLGPSMLGLLVAAAVVTCAAPSAPSVTQPEVMTPQPVKLLPGQKLRVVATTTIVADVVQRVGGEWIELKTLMGTGVDPHTFTPTPGDTAAVHDAHLLFASGAGFEAGLQEMLQSAGGGSIYVDLSQGLALLPWAGKGGARGTDAESVDPHVWFDVTNVMHWVATIETSLASADPAHKADYKANAREYVRELEALDSWIFGQVASIPAEARKLVVTHPVLGYLANRYGLVQMGAIYPISPAAEPSSREIAELEDAIRRYGVPAVFTESTVSSKLAEQVAHDTGVKLVPLFTDSLGPAGSGAESYVDLMRHDVTVIVSALR